MSKSQARGTKKGEAGQDTADSTKLMKRLYDRNMYETYLCIAILTFVGGFLNAYTFVLHGEYMATMNTGNMARIGLAISVGDMAGTAPYFMSIAANALGAMSAVIWRELICRYTKRDWQKLCLVLEIVVFFIIGLLPASTPHTPINFVISFMAGQQLASYTICGGRAVSTTIASGNVRFLGENMAHFILNPHRKNLGKLFSLFMIMVMFIFGSYVGACLSRAWGGYSLLLASVLLLIPLFCASYVSWYAAADKDDLMPDIEAVLSKAAAMDKEFAWIH